MRGETLFVVDRPAGSEWVPGQGARELLEPDPW
jgi:hypothetical protein